MHVVVAQLCPTLCDPMDCSSWQAYWSGLPCPSPGDLPNPGIEPGSLAMLADSLPSEPPGKLKREVTKICSSRCMRVCTWWVISLVIDDDLYNISF